MSGDNNIPFKTPSRGSKDAQAGGSKANSTYTDPPKGRLPPLHSNPISKNAPHAATEPIYVPSRPLSRQDPRHHQEPLMASEEIVKPIPGLNRTSDEDGKVGTWLRNGTMYGHIEKETARSSGFGSRYSCSLSPKERGSLMQETQSNRKLSDVSNPTGTPAKLKNPKRDFPVGYDQYNLYENEVTYIQKEPWSKPNIYPTFALNFQRPQRGWCGKLWEDYFISECERMFSEDFQIMAFRPERIIEIHDVVMDSFCKHLKDSDVENWARGGDATRTGSTMRLGNSPPNAFPGDTFANELDNRLKREQTASYRTPSAGVNSTIASPLGSTKAPSVESRPASKIRSSSNVSRCSQPETTSKSKAEDRAKGTLGTKPLGPSTKITSRPLAPPGTKGDVQGSTGIHGNPIPKKPLMLSKPPKPTPLQAEVDTNSATAKTGDLSPPRARPGPNIAEGLQNIASPPFRGKQKQARGRGSGTRGGGS